jgi:hypothetical protein
LHIFKRLFAEFGLPRLRVYWIKLGIRPDRIAAGRPAQNNEVRPHEAREMQTPVARFRASPRPLPARLPRPSYPEHAEVRRIHERGTIKFRSGIMSLNTTLAGETVALEKVDAGTWNVQFYHSLLGRRFRDNQILSTITGVSRKWRTHSVRVFTPPKHST